MTEKEILANKAAVLLNLKVKDFTDQSVRFEDPSYFFSIPWQSVERIAKVFDAANLIGPFICGVGGTVDDMGLHEYIQVCPALGLDGRAMYKKHTEYSAPGY